MLLGLTGKKFKLLLGMIKFSHGNQKTFSWGFPKHVILNVISVIIVFHMFIA